jgi:hypothetical protein
VPAIVTGSSALGPATILHLGDNARTSVKVANSRSPVRIERLSVN